MVSHPNSNPIFFFNFHDTHNCSVFMYNASYEAPTTRERIVDIHPLRIDPVSCLWKISTARTIVLPAAHLPACLPPSTRSLPTYHIQVLSAHTLFVAFDNVVHDHFQILRQFCLKIGYFLIDLFIQF